MRASQRSGENYEVLDVGLCLRQVKILVQNNMQPANTYAITRTAAVNDCRNYICEYYITDPNPGQCMVSIRMYSSVLSGDSAFSG